MIDVKQAIASAKRYAEDILGVSVPLLEEVHSDENWFEITLSFRERFERHGSAFHAT